MYEQIISLIAAGMILIAFLGTQSGKLHQKGIAYLLLNLIGSVILAIIAARAKQLGLTLLEGVWAIITLLSLSTVLYKTLLKS